ncbi:DUF4232 domain-containing protein [Actinacidiphila glaucinigra]|uniref:DUF4232 domain-containing protein n=1 Tax=Actinacidiphila glaucinigra TaxID=235986 RepID=UPI002DD92479|nr:DUF4232 domain-containing protein [Actinacidiphila glaucinigra]WSD57644.1 DUF4232 domain-containing protein [Actinacidiphila glaucinigra]
MNVKYPAARLVAVATGLVLVLGYGVSAQASANGPQTAKGKTREAATHRTSASVTVSACSQKDLGVSAVKEPADSTDARHLLLTVQNAGDKKCNVYRYPLVRLGAGRTMAPVIEDSAPKPGEPVTLAPGQEAYAALLVNSPMDEYEAKSITLSLQGRKPGSTAGKPIDVPMPVDTLYANDGQRVTYWTTAPGYALDFIMSR